MTRTLLLTGLLGLLLALPQAYAPAFSQDDKELRAERSEAHKARSEERKQRNQDLSDATRELRDYARDYAPILARPIGGELTRQEEQWNQREEQEVAKIAERNAKLLATYRNGQRLRDWERANAEEDFRLQWEEDAERQAITAQHSVYGMLLQPAQGEAAGQAFMERAAELAEQDRLIQIRYQQIKQENGIKRREEKKRILDA